MLKKQWIYNALFWLYSFKKTENLGPFFIIGTGRSGTHFLCSCLHNFDDLNDCFDGKESPYMFRQVSNLTINEKKLPRYIFGYYKYMQVKAAPKKLIDQTHPNIWHAEQLIQAFPRSKFLAISRNLFSVVYSMKNHPNVFHSITHHNNYPKPNRFLGITAENASLYNNSLSDLQRAVFKWCSHEQRIRELEKKFPKSVMRIRYDDLYENNQSIMFSVANFLNVQKPKCLQPFDEKSLYKKRYLTNDEYTEIKEALDLYNKTTDSNIVYVDH